MFDDVTGFVEATLLGGLMVEYIRGHVRCIRTRLKTFNFSDLYPDTFTWRRPSSRDFHSAVTFIQRPSFGDIHPETFIRRPSSRDLHSATFIQRPPFGNLHPGIKTYLQLHMHRSSDPQGIQICCKTSSDQLPTH